MRLIDVLHAVPGLLILGLLPGLALAELVAPSWPWWRRLALAPGLSSGLLGILGLVLHDLHVGFRVASVLPVVLALAGAAGAARWLRRAGRPATDRPLRRQHLALVAVALAAGAIGGAVVAASFNGATLPNEIDAPIHGAVAASIARQSDVLATQTVPIAETLSVRPRTAFEAEAALVSELGGPSPVAAMLPVVLLAVVLLPLSLAVLMHEATGSWRLAALASLLSVGMSFPGKPVMFGQYPYVLDATLVVPVVIAARLVLSGVHRRQNLLLLGAMVASIWVIHGLEILTAAVIGVPFTAGLLRGRRLRSVARDVAAVLGVAAVAALAVTLITRLPAAPAEQNPVGVTVSSLAPLFLGRLGTPSQSLQAISDFVTNELAAPIALALYLLGVAAILATRRLRWALVANAVLLLMFVDVGFTNVLHRLWAPVFPWATPDRLVGIQYFVVPLIMAWGIAHAAVVLPPVWRIRVSAAAVPRWLPASLAGAAAVVTAVWGGLISTGRLHGEVQSSSLATSADLAAIEQMGEVLPAGSVVLTDGELDAGQWIDAVSADLEFEPISYDRAHLYDGDAFDTSPQAMALAAACTDPAAAARALRGVDAVFVGSREKHDASHPWSLDCLEKVPGLDPVVRVTRDGWTAVVLSVARES